METATQSQKSKTGPLDILENVAFKYHGNWGGPNYSAGTLRPEQINWQYPSTDALDETFKKHDYNYSRMSHDDADHIWLQQAEQLPPTAKSLAAIAGFTVKTAELLPKVRRKRVRDPGNYPWDADSKKPFVESVFNGTKIPKVRSLTLNSNNNTSRKPVFDKTKGYEGEGPPDSSKKDAPKKSRAARRRAKRKAKAKTFKTTPSTKQPNYTAVRAQAKPQRIQTSNKQSYTTSGSILLSDLNGLAVTIPKYGSMLAASNITDTIVPGPTYFDLNPYSLSLIANQIGIPTNIEEFADFFEEWEAEFNFKWRAGCGNNTNGQLMWWIDEDPTDKDQLFFNSAFAASVAAQQGAVDFPIYQNFQMGFKTRGRHWLRQASGADVRKVSAGHMFFMTNQPLSSPNSYGQIIVDFKVTFHRPCARELNYASNYTSLDSSIAFPSGTEYVSMVTNGDTTKVHAVAPLSSTVVPYGSDLMVAAQSAGASGAANTCLVLNHGYNTPKGTYVQLHMNYGGSLVTSIGFTYFVGGVNVTTTLALVDINALDSTDGGQVFTCYIPPGAPADSAQVAFYVTSSASTTLAINIWTLPSVLFTGDFVMSFAGRPFNKLIRDLKCMPIALKLPERSNSYLIIDETKDDHCDETGERQVTHVPRAKSAPKLR